MTKRELLEQLRQEQGAIEQPTFRQGQETPREMLARLRREQGEIAPPAATPAPVPHNPLLQMLTDVQNKYPQTPEQPPAPAPEIQHNPLLEFQNKYLKPEQPANYPQAADEEFINRRGIDLAAGGESLVNTLKRIGNMLSTYGGPTAPNILPEPLQPFKEDQTMESLAQTQRGAQSLPENVLSGAIGFAPYALPVAGQALFGADLATNVAKDPMQALEMLKSSLESIKNVGEANLPFAASQEERAQAQENINQRPVEETVNAALPILIALGLAKGFKGKGAPIPERPIEGINPEATATRSGILQTPEPVAPQVSPIDQLLNVLAQKEPVKVSNKGQTPNFDQLTAKLRQKQAEPIEPVAPLINSYKDDAIGLGVRWKDGETEAQFDAKATKAATDKAVNDILEGFRNIDEAKEHLADHKIYYTARGDEVTPQMLAGAIKIRESSNIAPKSKFVMAVKGASNKGEVWSPVKGQIFGSREAADAGFKKAEQKWEESIVAGKRHPSWKGKFGQEYRIIEVPEGQSFGDIQGMKHSHYQPVAEKSPSVLKTETPESLETQSLKYKTPEEFINSKPILYQGGGEKFRVEKRIGGVYLTKNKKYAEIFKGKNGEIAEAYAEPRKPFDLTEQIEMQPERELLIEAPQNFPNEIAQIRSQGYDAITYKDQILVLDPTIVKTKSDLRDIYNKAHPKPTSGKILGGKVVKRGGIGLEKTSVGNKWNGKYVTEMTTDEFLDYAKSNPDEVNPIEYYRIARDKNRREIKQLVDKTGKTPIELNNEKNPEYLKLKDKDISFNKGYDEAWTPSPTKPVPELPKEVAAGKVGKEPWEVAGEPKSVLDNYFKSIPYGDRFSNNFDWRFIKQDKRSHYEIGYKFEYKPKGGNVVREPLIGGTNITVERVRYPERGEKVEKVGSNPDYAYRGMSYDEWVNAKKNGYIESEGKYNFAIEKGHTLFANNIESASSYAGGFAPPQVAGTFDRPSVIVAVPKSLTSQAPGAPGSQTGYLAVRGRIPIDQVRDIFYLSPKSTNIGEIEIVKDINTGRLRQGNAAHSTSNYDIIKGEPPDLAAQKVAPDKMVGKEPWEMTEAERSAIKLGIPQKSIDKLNQAMTVQDLQALKSVLSPGNKNLRKIFSERTGIVLPKTVGGTQIAISEWVMSVDPIIREKVLAKLQEIRPDLAKKYGKTTEPVKPLTSGGESKQGENVPAKVEGAWIESLPENSKKAVLEEMRSLFLKSEREWDKAKELQPRGGEIAVGSADFDHVLRASIYDEFRRAINKGKNPAEAETIAKDASKATITKHNPKRKDIEWQRDILSGDHYAEELRRKFESLSRGESLPPAKLVIGEKMAMPGLKEKMAKGKQVEPSAATAAKERIIKRNKGTTLGSGPLHGLPDAADLIIIGAAKLAKGLKYGDWSKVMVKELGETVKPHLLALYDESQKKLAGMTGKVEEPKPAPTMPIEPPKKPVESQIATSKTTETPTSKSGLSLRTEAAAIEAKLTKDFGDLPEYKTMDMRREATEAVKIRDADYKAAKEMAMGDRPIPLGSDGQPVRPASIYESVKLRALKEGDVETLRKLAVESKIPGKLSEYGQEIKAADSELMTDPVRAMQDIAKVRQEYSKKTGIKHTDQTIAALEKRLADAEAALSQKVTEKTAKTKTANYGARNRLVTTDAYLKAKEKIRASLATAHAGLPPELVIELGKIGTYHLEAGTRVFADWSAKMIEDAGDKIKPHLDDIWKKINDDKKIQTVLKAQKTRLEREKQTYETKLSGLDFTEKEKLSIPFDAELNRLKQSRDAAKRNYDAALNAYGSVTQKEASNIVDLSDKMMSHIGEMEKGEKSIEYGAARALYEDYVNHLKGADTPLSVLLKGGKEKFKTTWQDHKTKAVYDLGVDALRVIVDNSVSMVATLDNSFIGRQGLKTLMTHPTIWAKGAKNSFIDIWKTLGGQDARRALMADIYSEPNYFNGSYEKAGILAKHEEQFPTSLPARIPGIGRVFKASENAFTGSAIRMRTGLYDLLSKRASENGVDMTDATQIKSLGKLINSLTARGQWGKKGEPAVVRLVMWAPKMLKGNIDVLTAHGAGIGLESPFARKQAAINLLKIVAETATVIEIANALQPGSAETDPRSSDFGKIKIGNTRYDITGGAASIVTLASRIATGSRKSTTTGETIPYGIKFGQDSPMDALVDFLANKTNPPAHVVVDWLRGRDYAGKPFSWGREIYRASTPIVVQQAINLKDEFSANTVAGVILDGLGMNAQTYAVNNSESGTRAQIRQLQRSGKWDEAMKMFQDWNQAHPPDERISKDWFKGKTKITSGKR